jgi:hypothetical protein
MRTKTLRGSLIQLATACSSAALAAAAVTTLLLPTGCATASDSHGGDDQGGDASPQSADGSLPRPDADPLAPDAAPDARPGSPDAAPDADLPPDANIPQPADPELIDNLDDGNDHIAITPARRGSWYTFHDDTVGGVMTPGDAAFTLTTGGATASSVYYVHTTGHGFTDWGSGVGFDLNAADSGPKGKFNASAYTGIEFKAKGNVTIRFSVQIAAVLETTLGGTCVASTVEGMQCDDVHGKAVALTSSWATYQVPFSQLMQEGWGKPATFDKTTLTAVSYQMLPSATFDVSVDDVRFY